MEIQSTTIQKPKPEYKKDFPLFSRYPNLAYLDSCSTTQKPQCVIDALSNYYETSNANAHRGVYKISSLSSDRLENTRLILANFIGADSEEEIIFTKGTTESINLVAHSYLKSLLLPKDIILLGGAEHHANIVPWQIIAKEKHAKIEYINILDSGELDLNHFESLLALKPKFISIAHISNILGTTNEIEIICNLANKNNIPILIDGAQSASHMNINVKKLNCDFYTFSGHKAYAPMGIGMLYVKKNNFKKMQPFITGGGMIEEVNSQTSTYLEGPHKFEAGTQSIADIFAFGIALEYIKNIGIDEILKHETTLTKYAIEKLSKINGLELIGSNKVRTAPIFTFNLKNIHPHDLATLLDEKEIAVRAVIIVHKLQ
jgi:cysteine desulfurase/selenocysteine lyase